MKDRSVYALAGPSWIVKSAISTENDGNNFALPAANTKSPKKRRIKQTIQSGSCQPRNHRLA